MLQTQYENDEMRTITGCDKTVLARLAELAVLCDYQLTGTPVLQTLMPLLGCHGISVLIKRLAQQLLFRGKLSPRCQGLVVRSHG